jgi:hypothetical protein
MNHYNWLNKNLKIFFDRLEISINTTSLIIAHGDKCDQYKNIWAKENIPFEHGVAIYLLSHCPKWAETCRQTPNGFVPPVDWVINTYSQVYLLLPKI